MEAQNKEQIVNDIKKVHKTEWEDEANRFLRCGWILLSVYDGEYYLGQINKFICPVCNSEIDYNKMKLDNRGSQWHEIDCPVCGKYNIPRGIEIDEYFVDKKVKPKK